MRSEDAREGGVDEDPQHPERKARRRDERKNRSQSAALRNVAARRNSPTECKCSKEACVVNAIKRVFNRIS